MGNLRPQSISALSLVTATTTSGAVDVSFQEMVTIQFVCAGHSSGNGVFTVDASNDGTNWATGIAFQDGMSANSTTWITSKTLSANGAAMVIVPGGYKYIRVVCAVTTDGTYSAIVYTK